MAGAGAAGQGESLDIEPPGCSVLVVGCGNLLRGDDGVGPVLVRHLWERGVPEGARLVDGGTAGMDVAFQMRGAERVVIIDACLTTGSAGAAPGTVFRVPGAELEELPPLQGLHTHSFRWDNAIALARWALGEACPTDITVFLIEAAGVDLGAELSEPVSTAMNQVIDIIEADYLSALRPKACDDAHVEFTADGYVRLDAALAASRFPSDAVAAVVRDGDFWLIPLRGPRSGGLLLKQRNPAGDRATLVREVLSDRIPTGIHRAFWDDAQGALRVPLDPQR
ncbi:hydrogenase maturation protease [Mycolicibacterium komossense]|uniref:Hydrogenase maturation protease n=1 Tax=Mycolicibacterium komossense TaxID=1779 RepID=A0ABT3CN21_9MYCO|nr:hydrogenase maturation protease [Mycolicibacterium komossense]